MKREITAYIENNDAGKPCMSIPKLANEIVHQAGLDRGPDFPAGLTSRRAANRKKVRITITVEEV